MFEILPKSLIFNTENMFCKSIHLSLEIVDRLNWIWQDQGSLSAIIDIRTATNTTNYDHAHSAKKNFECLTKNLVSGRYLIHHWFLLNLSKCYLRSTIKVAIFHHTRLLSFFFWKKLLKIIDFCNNRLAISYRCMYCF